MPQLFSFSYQDGPLFGVAPINLAAPESRIGRPAHLHTCTKKVGGASFTAKGLYELNRQDGKVVAIHVPSEQDVLFPEVEPVPAQEGGSSGQG